MIVGPLRQPADQLQSRHRRFEGQKSVEIFPACRAQRFEPFAIDAPHPADMPAEMPLEDEAGERFLVEGTAMAPGYGADGGQGFDQRLGRDDEANAQCRKQHLAEGADIDDPVAALEALERRDLPPLIAVLAGVIDLDDGGIGTPWPG